MEESDFKTKMENVHVVLANGLKSEERTETGQNQLDNLEKTSRRIKCMLALVLMLFIPLYTEVSVSFVLAFLNEPGDSWTEWESWSNCSNDCGGGIQVRNRSCSNATPFPFRKQCVGNTEQVNSCNTQSCSRPRIAFTAYGAVGSNPLIFPMVIHNLGNGYDNSTGIFTCPIPGIYYFASTLTKSSNFTGQLSCFLYINSTAKLETGERRYIDDDEIECASMTLSGTFDLATGSRVYIGCSFDTGISNNSTAISFTGFVVPHEI